MTNYFIQIHYLYVIEYIPNCGIQLHLTLYYIYTTVIYNLFIILSPILIILKW